MKKFLCRFYIVEVVKKKIQETCLFYNYYKSETHAQAGKDFLKDTKKIFRIDQHKQPRIKVIQSYSKDERVYKLKELQ